MACLLNPSNLAEAELGPTQQQIVVYLAQILSDAEHEPLELECLGADRAVVLGRRSHLTYNRTAWDCW